MVLLLVGLASLLLEQAECSALARTCTLGAGDCAQYDCTPCCTDDDALGPETCTACWAANCAAAAKTTMPTDGPGPWNITSGDSSCAIVATSYGASCVQGTSGGGEACGFSFNGSGTIYRT